MHKGCHPEPAGTIHTIGCESGSALKDRFQQSKQVLSNLSMDFKVSGQDTNGGLLILEHNDRHKGGPPRHIHHSQEEWFYVLEGEYVLEVGKDVYRLNPGDSVLAPRKVPHVWAHTGEGLGRMIVGFQPAGKMESFFAELSKAKAVPDPGTMLKLFRAHDM